MNRSGAILVVVLLAVLALELVAMSALGLARIAQLGAVHTRMRASAQGAAEDAVAYAAATLRAGDVIAHPAGSRWPLGVPEGDTSGVAVHARRLDPGLVLLEAAPERGGAAAAAILRILPPDSILAAFPAVLSTAMPAYAPAAPPMAGFCPARHAPAARPAHALIAADDTLPFGQAAGIRWDHVEAMAAADSTWPGRAIGSQEGRFVAVAGDTVLAGAFLGVLVVRGDLRVQAGSELRGLAVVRGILVLDAGARLQGAARAFAIEDHGGSIAWDRCAVDAALQVNALQRAYRTSTRWRLPAF